VLDGEREIEFGPDEFPPVWLDLEGPLTVDVRRTLDLAAGEGLLRNRAKSSLPWQKPQLTEQKETE
jgi:hypothetical protein